MLVGVKLLDTVPVILKLDTGEELSDQLHNPAVYLTTYCSGRWAIPRPNFDMVVKDKRPCMYWGLNPGDAAHSHSEYFWVIHSYLCMGSEHIIFSHTNTEYN
jgi:hypothetical protein